MTNMLRLRGSDGVAVDLNHQNVMVEWFKFIDPPNPMIQREIAALGCGAAPGATASLNKDLYIAVTRHYQVGLWDHGLSINTGASFHAVELAAQALEHQILKAKWHNLDFSDPTVDDADGNSVTACAVWLERMLYDQTRPEVWTVLTGPPGKSGRIHEERYGMPRIVLDMEIVCMEGAKNLDGNGFPIDGAGGGTSFALTSFPPAAAVVYGGTAGLSFSFQP